MDKNTDKAYMDKTYADKIDTCKADKEKTYTERIQIHKENKLEGLHPSVKLLVVFLYSVCAFVVGSVRLTEFHLDLLLIPWFLIVPILCLASGVFRKSLKAVKTVAIVALIIFLVQTFLIPGGKIIFQLGFISIQEKGLGTAISLSFMVLDIAGIFVWMFQTTENREISRALEESGMNYKAAYVFTSTLQMIDILGRNSRTIMNAQKARGVETEGNVFIRARAFFPALVPLILGAIIGSEERVLTLEARGFSLKGERTHLFNLERSGWEKPAAVITIAISLLVIAGRVALWIA